MIERTIDEAARMSSTLPLESVFDRAPLRRALVAASLLVGSIAGLILVDSSATSRWVRAFVARDAIYWPRETQLVVKAVVQPGDRVREFRDGRLKHPRGVDLVLLVEAPEGTKVPAAVELNYVLDGGRGTGRMEMVKSHERQVPPHDFGPARQPLAVGLGRRLRLADSAAGRGRRTASARPGHARLRLSRLHGTRSGQPGNGRRGIPSKCKARRSPCRWKRRSCSMPGPTSRLSRLRIETDSRRISLFRDRATIAVRSPSGDIGPEQPLPAPSSGSFLSTTGSDAAIPFLLTAKAEPKKAEASSRPGGPDGRGRGYKPCRPPAVRRPALSGVCRSRSPLIAACGSNWKTLMASRASSRSGS